MKSIIILSLFVALAAPVVAQERPLRKNATTVQLPTFGVSIDAAGVLQSRTLEDPTGELRARRLQEAQQRLPADVRVHSPLRKVSLVRLERALRKRLESGAAADDVMSHLAGLQQVRHAFLYPDSGDIVIAGEAEGWVDDGFGHNMGLTTGRPVIPLADLLTALRAFRQPDAASFIGCTIDPTPEGLQRFERVRADIPSSIPDAQREPFAAELNRRTRESLGQAAIRVFGIPADSRMAAVLVEADYRMKRMALGVEPPPVRLLSYVARTGGTVSSPLQRYWFVPDYSRLRTDQERQSLEVLGPGLRLQTEELSINAAGGLRPSGVVDGAAQGFCTDFTRQYDEIAAHSPVYAEMRNSVDLLVVAAFMRHERWFARAGWEAPLLLDERTIPNRFGTAPTSADVLVNTLWKGRRLISAAGGGVSIRVDYALDDEHLRVVERENFQDARQKIKPPDDERWWWD